jgi:hypothetical protein
MPFFPGGWVAKYELLNVNAVSQVLVVSLKNVAGSLC